MGSFCKNEEANLVRKPIDLKTGKEYEKSEYALFTGCTLDGSEPELVVKLYDSLHFQHPDLGVILMCCEETNEFRRAWEELGKPIIICSCPTCQKKLKEQLPEIRTISLYRHLTDLEISGGCHEETYCIWEEKEWEDFEIAKAIAEDMGAIVISKAEGSWESAGNETCPFLTCDISIRNKLRDEGKKAFHLLELIYGIGNQEPLSPQRILENRLELKQSLIELCFTA